MRYSDFLNWLGGALVVAAILGGTAAIIWVVNNTGNQLAKKCIASGGNWILVDDGSYNRSPLYECQRGTVNRSNTDR